jgi:hypothetical protein
MASDAKVLDTSGNHSVEIGEATIDLQWLPEDGVSLLRSYRGKDNLTDDDVTVIALVLSQAILTRYLHPDGGKHAWETVNDLLTCSITRASSRQSDTRSTNIERKP